jgi:hypothetical protein
MEKIQKILEINHPSFDYVKNFFESLNFDDISFPKNIGNDFIYYDNVSPKSIEILVGVESTSLRYLQNDILIEKIKESVEYIKENFNVKLMWLMVYPPKTYIDFHVDNKKNRHLISFNKHERFFSYESNCDKEFIYNQKYKENINNIDEFNSFFIKDDLSNEITNLESNSVYIFNNTLHCFYNDSNKLRVNLVFEV